MGVLKSRFYQGKFRHREKNVCPHFRFWSCPVIFYQHGKSVGLFQVFKFLSILKA